jgi:Putative S-adenosyl-L-methionine-dependent methyltransferase
MALCAPSRIPCLLRRAVRAAQFATQRFSTSVLLRDFIQEALYSKQSGYFVAGGSVVGKLPKPLQFRTLLDRSEYNTAISSAYSSAKGAWYTPSELFQPLYSIGLVRHILRRHASAEPLVVFELGGGTGTNSACFLDALKRIAPAVYANTRYINVEISATLAEAQRATTVAHPRVHNVMHADAAAASTWAPLVSASPCYVIALELLDNLPHDRVCLSDDGTWSETRVYFAQGKWQEQLQPVADPLIKRCLDIYTQHSGRRGGNWLERFLLRDPSQSGSVFLPTTCLQLLESITAARPQHCLLLSDFDALPGVTIEGVNAPLVASRSGHDYGSYLAAADGSADIMFPTSFGLLAAMIADTRRRYKDKSCGSVRILSSADFYTESLEAHEISEASTASGWNPLLHDFPNTRFLIDLSCDR